MTTTTLFQNFETEYKETVKDRQDTRDVIIALEQKIVKLNKKLENGKNKSKNEGKINERKRRIKMCEDFLKRSDNTIGRMERLRPYLKAKFIQMEVVQEQRTAPLGSNCTLGG